LRTPGTEPGQAAVRAIRPAFDLGLISGTFCGDRGISQARPEHLHLPLLEMGLDVVKHYNDDHVDRQNAFRGMELVGGEFYCPLMPHGLVTAGADLIAEDATKEQRDFALTQIRARDDYRTRVKEYGPQGDQRRQCPAVGKYATVTCHRRPQSAAPGTVDLDAPKTRTAAALPRILKPKSDAGPYPDICTKDSITVPGTVLAKWRQKYSLFSDKWREAWSNLRSQNEGGNGNLKKECLDSIAVPQKRLARGRVAQTLLVAVIICIANLRAIDRFRRDRAFVPRKTTSAGGTAPTAEPTPDLPTAAPETLRPPDLE
jgi:hypothetical protein